MKIEMSNLKQAELGDVKQQHLKDKERLHAQYFDEKKVNATGCPVEGGYG